MGELLKVGDTVTSFSLADKDGVMYALEDLSSGKDYTVVFFYPRDNTPGCSIEVGNFQARLKEFEALNVGLIGISGGDEKSKTKFCEKYGVTYPLLSDADSTVGTEWGVFGEKKFMGRIFDGFKRVSFVLDKDLKVLKVYEKVKPAVHAQELLDYLKSL